MPKYEATEASLPITKEGFFLNEPLVHHSFDFHSLGSLLDLYMCVCVFIYIYMRWIQFTPGVTLVKLNIFYIIDYKRSNS